jgi:5-methylthioadenosine/S-adenosylhomocysteine deaminase
LLAHCITVNDHDIDLIRSAGAGIAHCPRSNAKLRHGRAPFAKFVAADLKLGLGSDSVASNNECDILAEARFASLLARVTEAQLSGRAGHANLNRGTPAGARADGHAPNTVTAKETLFAATLGGARAMGLDHQIGAVAEGMQADLTVVGLDGAHQQPTTDPVDTLIFSSSGRDVLMTMVAGKEVYRNGRITVANESDLRQQLVMVRKQLSNLAGQEI